MRLKNVLAGLSGLALVSAPVAASANPVAALSVGSTVRASSDRGSDDFAAPGAIIGLVLFAAVVAAGVYLAVDDDSDSN